ncbi:MAG TPA: cytochrome c1 [Casimicrobiaceae bacterium]|nr:cytochrome c1 [Casimicrobiaceae bacterium]
MRTFAMLILLSLASVASAAEGGIRLAPAPVDRLDEASLQRGARNFVNYCLTCHTAKYMRYNRLTDIGLTEAQIADNLMFATDKIGGTMTVAMTPAEGKTWFGAAPPDLTVEARIRGRDWLYNYLLGFYRDEKSATGWNNLVFPNVGMPHVLWQLSGINKLVETEYEDHEKATAAAIAVKGLSAIEPLPGNKFAVLQVAPDVPGTLSRVEYDTFVTDLVNYMDYMAEPVKNRRIHLGIIVLLFLGVLFVFAYALKREYWKDLH